jgi:hypothetical protein
MPIDLSNLSAEDITTATAAVEAARRAREEREHREVEEQQKQQEEERVCQEVTVWKAEERKEVAVRKAEAEWRDRLAREKAAQEEVAAKEHQQSLATGLSGLKLTIPAPASIAQMTSGSSTQSKGKRRATEEEPSMSQYIAFIPFLFLADFLWRSRFPLCDSCTIVGIPCLMELWKNGMQQMLCDWCHQLKKVCHWDLVGVMGPRDPSASKWSRSLVKKPVIDMDEEEEVMGRSLPSPAADLMSLSFILRNVANALVTESATLWATFIHFHDKISGSLNKLMEFMVKEQAEARKDRHAVLGLLQWLVVVAEGVPSRQTEIVLATVAGNAEAGPSGVVVGLIRRARTPLFLPSDENMEPSDESYIDEAKGSGSGNEESSAEGSEDMEENAREDVEEDEEEVDEMDVDQMLRD